MTGPIFGHYRSNPDDDAILAEELLKVFYGRRDHSIEQVSDEEVLQLAAIHASPGFRLPCFALEGPVTQRAAREAGLTAKPHGSATRASRRAELVSPSAGLFRAKPSPLGRRRASISEAAIP